MSAELKLVEDVKIDGRTYEAAVILLEDQEKIIRSLRKQNERLAEEKLQAELVASLEVAKSKFAAAQMYQRVLKLEQAVEALEKAQDRTGNFVQGLVQRDQEYENMRSNVSFLMGNVEP